MSINPSICSDKSYLERISCDSHGTVQMCNWNVMYKLLLAWTTAFCCATTCTTFSWMPTTCMAERIKITGVAIVLLTAVVPLPSHMQRLCVLIGHGICLFIQWSLLPRMTSLFQTTWQNEAEQANWKLMHCRRNHLVNWNICKVRW